MAVAAAEEEEEVEAAVAPAAAVEEAPDVLVVAATDLEAVAEDPAQWGTDRAWAALEADQRLTAGYEKVKGMGSGRKKKPSAQLKIPD